MSNIQPIRCLAITNRGEAAMRCIRAVKSLGAQEGIEIRVVALYTEVDRRAPFVRHADVAHKLEVPGATAVSAYLDHARLIAAVKKVGADAVWPGWGFVAEDPVFVDRLTAAGIRFLGPSANTMRALGDKISSKELAERADVPVTAWSKGVVKTEAEARKWAEEIGYPLVIKASAGGGGRGIRVVRDPSTLESSFQSAGNEALQAFGDGRLFMEAMVQGGRHIEVQIAADQHGTVVAVGCRDCSVQRRHQKVLEEAPPVGLPPLMIHALTESAVSLASSVGYHGVGTVEFLVSGADYFFLEMNPRLQVEHGITEELTGIDLVQLQIRIARGEKLPVTEFRERGHVIEARVCAEDPDAGFLPAPGRIARFDPALGPRLRIDTGVASDSRVPPDFDSLIAKVIASGDTREEAMARLVVGLRDFDLVIEGGATNKSYLLEILGTPEFRKGGVDTGWLDRYNAARVGKRAYASEALVLAAIVAYQEYRKDARTNFFRDPGNLTKDKVPASVGQEIDLSYAGKQYRVTVYASGSYRYRIHFEGRAIGAHLAVSGAHAARLQIGERDLRVLYDVAEANIRTEVEGSVHQFGRQTAGQVRAGAPSMVVNLNVKVGDVVKAGQSLGLLEAMKMEIGFDAPVGGTVTEVRARKGQQVAAGDTILVIDPAGDDKSDDASGVVLELPSETDPLSALFRCSETGALLEPDLVAAAASGAEERNRALLAVGNEIRRIVLGYDAYGPRVEKLIDFLRAPMPESLPREFLEELAGTQQYLQAFVDVETLFVRKPSIDGAGTIGPSNNEQFRIYVRRMRAKGEGLPESFIETLRAALRHYDYSVQGLEYVTDLERCVMRLFASQLDPKLRQRLVIALIYRVATLAQAGMDFTSSEQLRKTLTALSLLRGQVSDSLADAATEASYTIFQRPELDRAAEHTTQRVDQWLAQEDERLSMPPGDVLTDLSMAPPGKFREIEAWLGGNDERRRAVALGAYVRRIYAPRIPLKRLSTKHESIIVTRLDFDAQPVFTAFADAAALGKGVAALLGVARGAGESTVLELVTSVEDGDQVNACIEAVRQALGETLVVERVTLSVVSPTGSIHETFVRGQKQHPERRDLLGVHPEAAARIDLERYQSFELERIPSAEGIYCFYGKSREVPEDERIFVLADVRTRPPEDGQHASLFIPGFEQAFFEAARTLRTMIAERDVPRRLQWNRIVIFLAQPITIDTKTAHGLARKLHPATRHLGLERVGVRFRQLDPAHGGTVKDVEIIVSDPTGNNMEIAWREPHDAPLVPATDYVRRVLAAKRRGLIYPYEIIRMLAPAEGNQAAMMNARAGRPTLPSGEFEEFDLDPVTKRAKSVLGRDFGKNSCSIVFGVIKTPTVKVPEGMRRVLVLSDPTRGMGALAGEECDRVVAAIDLAEELGMPVEWLPVSSGAKIAMDSGTENLDATARVVRRIVTFTQKNGVIHLIITGVNVGAQSYWNALATMLGHTRGVLIMTPQASMVLTGRAALTASGSVAAEDEVAIGGYERVMGPNGQAQYYATDLASAFALLYQHYEYTYVSPGERGPRKLQTTDPAERSVMTFPYDGEGFREVGEMFLDATNPGRKKPFSMRDLMVAIIDQDGGYLERWQRMVAGETAIVWDAHLGGTPVCVIGIESQNVPRLGYRPLDGPMDWNGGTLFPQSSKKVARALNAASGNRPLVVIANLSGFDGSPESMRKLQLEFGAEIARAVVNFEGPLVFLVVSRYHGGAYVVFSRELNDGLRAFAVEGSYASVIGGGPAAAVVFPREVESRVSADPRTQKLRAALKRAETRQERRALHESLEGIKLEKQAEVAAEFDAVHSVDRAKRVGSLEGIIAAKDIRPHLIRCLLPN